MARVGQITDIVINLLGLAVTPGTPIHIEQSNITHMKNSHPQDYAKYGASIEEILSYPDYVGKNPNDGSIEYVKEYDADGNYVKVAVRVSTSGNYYARSIYILNNQRTQNFIAKGTLKHT